MLAALLLLAYIFVYEKAKGISVLECFLVLFLVILIGLGPKYLKKEITRWTNKFYSSKIKKAEIPTPWGPIAIELAQSPEELKTLPESAIKILSKIREEKTYGRANVERAITMVESIAKQKLENNLINNGDFKIPLSSILSKWGHGLYSEKIRRQYPGINFAWINFLKSDISISIEETEIGNALKIMHKSETAPDKVGIMEQYIKVLPGIYKLSFWAKALEDFEEEALWIATNDDWLHPHTVGRKGPFKWQPFSKDITIDKPGVITFTIISQGKGTIYISDISLIKIPDRAPKVKE